MMNLDLITDILMLIVAIIGLLGCFFSFIEYQRKGWLLVAGFFLANLLSDYYWTVYTLVMHFEPDVSEFIAYFGWNVGYVVLLFAVIHLKDRKSKGYFSPMILVPIPITFAQFLLYISYGGIFNNVWQVGFSTAVLCVCCQAISYYVKNKKKGAAKPYFHITALLFICTEYVMWTSSCFDWPSDLLNPYYYFAVFGYIIEIFFAWSLSRHYQAFGFKAPEKNSVEIRFYAVLQTIVSLIVIGGCVGGYYIANGMKSYIPEAFPNIDVYKAIVVTLFSISAVLCIVILILSGLITVRFKKIREGAGTTNLKRRRLNLILTLVVTFVMMVFMVIYNSRLFYNGAIRGVYSSGEDKADNVSTELDNYLTMAMSTLNVCADSVDLMLEEGDPTEKIEHYLTDQTNRQFKNFDENFTGIYAFVRGIYMDGSGWVPPAGYDSTVRDWYKMAVEANGKTIIVSPYVDAQTGAVVITICRMVNPEGSGNSYRTADVVALDVIVGHIQEVTEATVLGENSFTAIVNSDGFIVAHQDKEMVGQALDEVYGEGITEAIVSTDESVFEYEIDEETCTLFVSSVMGQWYVVLGMNNMDLLGESYSQLTVNVVVSITIFLLISIFYYLSYRNEQAYGKKVEEMNATRQKQEYEAEVLRLEKASADEANKAKSNFLADMSHEIRTPINAILGMNEMILREAEGKNIKEYAANIRNSGKNLLQLINSILDFSKIEDGKMEIVPVRYSLSSMITYLVNSVQERAEKKKLKFDVNIDPGLPSELNGDDARISQVILNLLTNAVKYTHEGSISFNVKEKERKDDIILLYVEVKDTGIGIKESDMGRLFESFERLDVVKNRTIEGTGLGMSITTRLLDLMGSGLNVKSKYGEGSVFSFELWQKIESSEPIGEYRIGTVEDDEEDYTESFHAPDAHILLVDDTRMNIMVAVNLLKKTDIRIDTASGGEEAIKLADEKTYDCILLDQRMPGMDGTETLKRIRALENKKNLETPVICLTADAIRGAKERYIAEGFNDYLTKPVEGRELEQMLIRYLPKEKVRKIKNGGEGASQDDLKKDSVLKALLESGFDVEKALVYAHGDSDLYKVVLSMYVEEYEDHSGRLDEYFKNKDWENYSILVHSVKSTSRTIGSEGTAELAATLEDASRRSDETELSRSHGTLQQLYKETTVKIKGALGDSYKGASTSEEVLEFEPEASDAILEFKPDDDDDDD